VYPISIYLSKPGQRPRAFKQPSRRTHRKLFAAVGIKKQIRIAFFPIWFFAIGMIGNAIWHPPLCLATRSYFPGLFTSPFAGVIGVILLSRLLKLTRATVDLA
jgi:hypothetical protein